MEQIGCPYEADVLLAVDTGRWPNRAETELRTHVAVCAICQDVVEVGATFRAAASDLATSDTQYLDRLPEASLVWWRAKIRARADATRLAARPITVAQAVACSAVVGVFGALVGATSSWVRIGVQWLGAIAQRFDPRGVTLPEGVAAALSQHVGVFVVMGVCVMLTPIAVYLAIREN